MKTLNPAITASTVSRRESYPEWMKRREQEHAQQQARVQSAAHHVMDVIDAISGPLPPPSPMEKAVEALKLRPVTAPPRLHLIAREGAPYLTLIALIAAFLAGVVFGKI